MKNRILSIFFLLQICLLLNASSLQSVLASQASIEKSVATRGLTAGGAAPSNERLSGIVIGEPVVFKPDVALSDFGAGCGRWLFWAVGGLPDLGATPAWSDLNEIEGRLNRKDLRLSASAAGRLSDTLGVNRVATGEIKGDAQNCTLTYQVYSTIIKRDSKFNKIESTNAPLGEPIIVTGSREQIVAQLPSLARQILLRCGMEEAPQFAPVGATPDDLALCGLAQTSGEIPDARREEFLKLAARLPLANLLTALYDTFDDEETAIAARAQNQKWFLEQAPNNALMFGELVPLDEKAGAEYSQALSKQRIAFPANYNLARAMTNWLARNEDLEGARAAADDAVNAALFNPLAHLLQADVISSQAGALREGRMRADITTREYTVLKRHYTDWYIAALRATRLDPGSSSAWAEAATATTFYGFREFAEYALDRALLSNPRNLEAFRWGFQMYQPKWTDKGSKKLNELAAKAMKNDEVFMALYDDILEALDEDPESAQNNAPAVVAEKALGLLRKAATENPEVMELQLEIATLLISRPNPTPERIEQAQQHLERALELDPKSAIANLQMGVLFKVHLKDKAQAEKYLRRAAELDPDWPLPQMLLEEPV